MRAAWREICQGYTFPYGRRGAIIFACLLRALSDVEVFKQCIIVDAFPKFYNCLRTGTVVNNLCRCMEARARYWSTKDSRYGYVIRQWLQHADVILAAKRSKKKMKGR